MFFNNYYILFIFFYIHMSFGFCLGLEQPPDRPSASQAQFQGTQSMDVSEIEEVFLTAARKVVKKVLDGLSVTSLRESERRAALQNTSAKLPVNFTSISEIKAMLDKLIDLSEQLQKAHSEFAASSSGQVDQAVDEAKKELSAREHALQVAVQEIVSVEKKKDELNRALQELNEKERQLLETRSALDSAVKQQEQALCDATAKASTRARKNLEAKTMVPAQEAEKLLGDLVRLLPTAD